MNEHKLRSIFFEALGSHLGTSDTSFNPHRSDTRPHAATTTESFHYEIVLRNIERFSQLLDGELEPRQRTTIERLLGEHQAKLRLLVADAH